MRFRALGAVSALGLTLASGCGLGSGGAEVPPEPKPVIVEFTTVEPETLRDVATFSGELSAEKSVIVKSETDGLIEGVFFAEGQSIERGGLLYRLRNDEQRARLAEAEANLSLAREINARTQQLVDRNAASLAQKDRSHAELRVALARVDLARLQVERTEIRAPFDGVLGLRLVDPGDRITDETPLVQIDAIDRLQVTFGISDIGILFARSGAPVDVMVAPYPDDRFPGEVFFVSPSLDRATRLLIVKAWVPNEHGRLRAGLFANVDLELYTREEAILVPESAIVFDRKGTYVWRLDDDDVATRVPIEVGLRKHGRVEVKLGLHGGDRIVSAGTHKVSEGSQVAFAPEESSLGQALRVAPADEAAGEGT